MINVEHLKKSFGPQSLFTDISFKINAKERIGLVGRNGHGKTTLFRLIAGEEQPDAGSIALPKNYRIGYVRQQFEFTQQTVLEEGARSLSAQETGQYWKVEKILTGLGFSLSDMQRHPAEFSGGYQVRLNLAKILIAEPDLLLLDEPTNYLDITSIRWVERFLNSWQRELMLITHDRSFMDKVVTHVIGIHRKKIRKIVGNTEKYYAQIAQEEEIYEKTRLNDERRRKEIQTFISRFRAKARLAGLVQSRIKTLKKLDNRQKLEAAKTLDFSFKSRPFHGRHILTVQDLIFSYNKKTPLIENFNVTIHAGERVCVIGKNGKGKTTLLKLLGGMLAPQSGRISFNPGVTIGLFEQTNVGHLVDSRTVEEEILSSQPDGDRQQARNICGAMLFEGDQALKKIQILSGGEKCRVLLGKLIVTPANLLILDEPTNHLDMDACDALLAAIDSFDGTVVLVTHNEMFLDALADRLIIFQEDAIDVFDGSYQEFLERIGWQEERIRQDPHGKEHPVRKAATKLTKKELRRQRSEVIARRSGALKKIEQQIRRIEREIELKEDLLLQLNQEILEASQAQNGDKISAASKAIHSCRTEIDTLYDQLENLARQQEKKQSAFDKQLAEIDSSEN